MLKAILLFSLVAFATCGFGVFETVDVNDERVVAATNHAVEGLSNQFASNYQHRAVGRRKKKQKRALLETGLVIFGHGLMMHLQEVHCLGLQGFERKTQVGQHWLHLGLQERSLRSLVL
ncbi:hypothetical protein TNIN_328361 [Trichonephila inaurata madagascariensis]|uniref:Uncharacterized protein n=1 Tax=Trichonephila inaurata madagascariensis TaxID=2747483 RepID=A0A8X7BNX7_9ARAC|nr:hypothetical protein TNIN_328361 [Trichonephila inaurata madagascariensis]